MRKLFVLNAGEGTVSIVDLELFRETERVDLDLRADTRRGTYLSPREAITNKDGQRIYILCPFDDLLLCCDTDLHVIFSQSVPSNPVGIVLSPDQMYCYIVCADSDSIMQLSATSGRQLAMVRTRPYPIGICVDHELLCACMSGRCVTSYDLLELIPEDTAALKGMPVCICSLGDSVVVSQLMCNEEWDGCITLLDANDVVPITTIKMDMPPGQICTIKDGYIVAENGGDRLKIFNKALECIGEARLNGSLESMVYDSEANLVYISISSKNCIVAFDCEELQEKARLYVGLEPAGMVIV